MEQFNSYPPVLFPNYPTNPLSVSDPPVAMAYPAVVPQSSGGGYAPGMEDHIPAPNYSIIGSQFCAPSPLDLAVARKVMTVSDGNFVVEDVNCNILFKVKGALLSIHDRRVLLDATGNPIVTLRKKVLVDICIYHEC